MLLFRVLEAVSRVGCIVVMSLLWGPVVAVVFVLDAILMLPYWAWEGDKVMENMKALCVTTMRIVFSMLVFPGFGDIAPDWVVDTKRLPALYHLLVRGAQEFVLAVILLSTGIGNEEGVSDGVVATVGALLLLKLPAAYWYYKELSVIDGVSARMLAVCYLCADVSGMWGAAGVRRWKVREHDSAQR